MFIDATEIFEALQVNQSVKTLDISFNPIGTMNRKNLNVFTTSKISIEPGNDSKIEITEDYLLALKEMFIQNKTLIHCDFSHCGLSLYECEIMNEGLKKNHTILGIHMVGNKMNVDSLGFLKSDELIPSL